ncbi:MAG: hypothetical protein ABIT96_09665, partial [Ferruginibacter sp.]
MKWKLLSLFLSACLVVLLVAFVSVKKTEPRFEAAKEIIVLRNIAHEVLQYSGDSNSRVLPVTRISANEFLLNFESPFSFKPDSLVRIIGDLIEANHLPRNYIVNVLESGTENVVYGFAMFRHKQNNIVPCLGRDQPLKKYSINI